MGTCSYVCVFVRLHVCLRVMRVSACARAFVLFEGTGRVCVNARKDYVDIMAWQVPGEVTGTLPPPRLAQRADDLMRVLFHVGT